VRLEECVHATIHLVRLGAPSLPTGLGAEVGKLRHEILGIFSSHGKLQPVVEPGQRRVVMAYSRIGEARGVVEPNIVGRFPADVGQQRSGLILPTRPEVVIGEIAPRVGGRAQTGGNRSLECLDGLVHVSGIGLPLREIHEHPWEVRVRRGVRVVDDPLEEGADRRIIDTPAPQRIATLDEGVEGVHGPTVCPVRRCIRNDGASMGGWRSRLSGSMCFASCRVDDSSPA
jgi:hypothetical protein